MKILIYLQLPWSYDFAPCIKYKTSFFTSLLLNISFVDNFTEVRPREDIIGLNQKFKEVNQTKNIF